jgi:hypothetical protein
MPLGLSQWEANKNSAKTKVKVYLNPTGSGVFFQSDYSGATFFGIS